MLVLPSSPICNLLVGMSGMPRHVMNGEPKRLTVAAALRDASPPVRMRQSPSDARGKRRASSRRAPEDHRDRPVKAYPCGRRDADAVRDFVEQAKLRMIDQLPLLALFDCIDGQAHLLAKLVDSIAIKISNAGMRVEHRLDGAEMILARIDLVVDKGRRKSSALRRPPSTHRPSDLS